MISKNLVKYIIVLIAIIALVLSIIAVAKKCKDKFDDGECTCIDYFNPMYNNGKMQKWFCDRRERITAFPYGPHMVKYDVNKPPFIPCYNSTNGICEINLTESKVKWMKTLGKYITDNFQNMVTKVAVPKDYANLDAGWELIPNPSVP